MREVVFRIGLLFFCLTIIVCVGSGLTLENTVIRSSIVFFCFISLIYILMYVFTQSDESRMKVRAKLVDELLHDDNFEIINHKIEEKAKDLMQEELLALKEAEESEIENDDINDNQLNDNELNDNIFQG